MGRKKVVYIAGPITGVHHYWEEFERYEDALSALGYTALLPSRLPSGMSNAQYMRICLSMIDTADAVLFLPGSKESLGATVERTYCTYIDKPMIHVPQADEDIHSVRSSWLREALEGVFKS